MKVVFIIPNFDTYVITPQLGVMYISSYVKKYGHQTVIIDALRDNLNYEQILSIVNKENPDCVGIHCLSSFYDNVVALSRMLKNNGFRVYIGGVHPTFVPYTTLLESEADYVMIGEGEIPTLKLLNNNFVNNNIQGVYSIQDLKDDFHTIDGNPIQKAEIIQNLDDLPFPDWESCPPDSYPHAPHAVISKNYPIGIITTSRGCPFRCTFCSSHNFYNGVRFRSIDNVIKEIKYLIDKFHIKELQFIDDNLTLKKSYIIELCKKIKSEKILIDWTPINGVRADSIDDVVAIEMKSAGCYLLDFGIESVNSSILKNIKKGETIEQITKAINCAHNAGLLTIGNFIFGLPGETKDTIEETINYACRSKLDRAGFFALNVLPGSDIANFLREKGIIVNRSSLFSNPDFLVCDLSSKEIQRYIQKAYWKFYFRPSILFKVLFSIPIRQYKYFFKVLAMYNIFKIW